MYDYIQNHYGKTFKVGDRVTHTVTNHCGEVKREKKSHLHYVRVHFGSFGLGLCHPNELEHIESKEGE